MKVHNPTIAVLYFTERAFYIVEMCRKSSASVWVRHNAVLGHTRRGMGIFTLGYVICVTVIEYSVETQALQLPKCLS